MTRHDVVIVGGGAQGLATAYHLARRHGVRKVAVLESGRIGGRGAGGNSVIVHSAARQRSSAALFELSRELFESLSSQLNYNLLFTRRGVLHLAFSGAELDSLARTADAARHGSISAWMVPPSEVASLAPLLQGHPHEDLPLLLFLPWFLVLGGLFVLWPPRTRGRWRIDVAVLLLALLCSAGAMRYGYQRALLDVGAGAIWPQVVATQYAYGTFLLVLGIAWWLRRR